MNNPIILSVFVLLYREDYSSKQCTVTGTTARFQF